MPSKLTSTAWMSGMSAEIGCVEGSWSCRYAQVFHRFANVVHEPVHRVDSDWHTTLRYGPATSAVMYGEIGGVGEKCQRPSAEASGALFEMTCQSAGAVTLSSNRAFRSGWSKQVYIWCASLVSNCECR